jgi:hypothetical protein
MLSRSYTPTSPLGDFIADFWRYADYRPAHLKERVANSAEDDER